MSGVSQPISAPGPSHPMPTLDHYLHAFRTLHVNRAGDRASPQTLSRKLQGASNSATLSRKSATDTGARGFENVTDPVIQPRSSRRRLLRYCCHAMSLYRRQRETVAPTQFSRRRCVYGSNVLIRPQAYRVSPLSAPPPPAGAKQAPAADPPRRSCTLFSSYARRAYRSRHAGCLTQQRPIS